MVLKTVGWNPKQVLVWLYQYHWFFIFFIFSVFEGKLIWVKALTVKDPHVQWHDYIHLQDYISFFKHNLLNWIAWLRFDEKRSLFLNCWLWLDCLKNTENEPCKVGHSNFSLLMDCVIPHTHSWSLCLQRLIIFSASWISGCNSNVIWLHF